MTPLSGTFQPCGGGAGGGGGGGAGGGGVSCRETSPWRRSSEKGNKGKKKRMSESKPGSEAIDRE